MVSSREEGFPRLLVPATGGTLTGNRLCAGSDPGVRGRDRDRGKFRPWDPQPPTNEGTWPRSDLKEGVGGRGEGLGWRKHLACLLAANAFLHSMLISMLRMLDMLDMLL